MAKVSIIVPVYNVEQYLEKCLETLINQTLKDIEIIVVNDGSPDNSQEIIDKYATLDERIVVIKKENGGLSDARNQGIRMAKGEYIGFVDSDDYVSLNMFEKLYAEAVSENSDLVVCNYLHVYEDNHIEEYTSYRNCIDPIRAYILGSPAAWNKLYHRSLLNDNYWPKGLYYEDFACNSLLSVKAKKISFVTDNLYYYLIRDNSIMRKKTFNEKNGDILVGANLVLSAIRSDKRYEEYFEEYEYMICNHLVHGVYINLRHINDKKKYELLREISIYVRMNFPNLSKNKYFKEMNLKYKIVYNLILNRHYFLLKYLLRDK